jgi:hypothetical protein
MNLEIHIKVPVGTSDVSIMRPLVEAAPAAEPQPPPEDFLPPSRPLSFDDARADERAGPAQRNGSVDGNGTSDLAPGEEGPPSLEELGIEADALDEMGPPSPEALGIIGGHELERGGTPPGLEGLDLPDTQRTPVGERPPAVPELDRLTEASADVPPPPPEELTRASGAKKAGTRGARSTKS